MINRNTIDFAGDMAARRDIAASARYKGRSTGKAAKGHVGIKVDGTGRRKRFQHLSALEYELQRLEYEYEAWVAEWKYSALAAVETALFAPDYQEI